MESIGTRPRLSRIHITGSLGAGRGTKHNGMSVVLIVGVYRTYPFGRMLRNLQVAS